MPIVPPSTGSSVTDSTPPSIHDPTPASDSSVSRPSLSPRPCVTKIDESCKVELEGAGDVELRDGVLGVSGGVAFEDEGDGCWVGFGANSIAGQRSMWDL
jgi:hypothetical protein